MVSKAKIQANSRYNQRKYDVLSIRVDKTERINELLDIVKRKTGQSKAEYILGAIQARLQSDNVTLDTLPPRDDQAPGT